MQNQDSFKRGTVELALLAVLREEDLYGYEIVQKIAQKSDNNFILPLGTLYPVLYRLTESGCISDRDEIVGKRLRKYYHLEERGREYFAEMLKEYRKIEKGIDLITKGSDKDEE